jgi:hypothetical protein
MKRSLLLFLLLIPAASAECGDLFSPHLGSLAHEVKAATFAMGIEDETRQVAVDTFYVKATMVSVDEFAKYLADNPDAASPEYWSVLSQNREQPVVGVDLRGIVPFLKWMNAVEGQYVYRLPTEAEWRQAHKDGALDDADKGMAEFMLDRFSDSFADWKVEEGVIHNPFGPIPGLNVVGLRPMPGNRIFRDAVAPDYVGLHVGFRYAFSPSGPGPLGVRTMKEAMLKQMAAGGPAAGKAGLPPGQMPPGGIPSKQGQAAPPGKAGAQQLPPAAAAGGMPLDAASLQNFTFPQLFSELVRQQSEVGAERQAYYASHPAFALFERVKSDPLVVAGEKAAAMIREKGIDKATYDSYYGSISKDLLASLPAVVAYVYKDVVLESLRSMPPRDADDQQFYAKIGPQAQTAPDLGSNPLQLPYPEGSVEGLIAFRIIEDEIQKFGQYWLSTIGRVPPEILAKEAKAKELSQYLATKYPRELKSVTENLTSITPSQK